MSISTANAATITFATITDTVNSLTTAATDTLSLTSGALTVLYYGQLAGAFSQSGGSLTVGGLYLNSTNNFKQTAGAITVKTGSLQLSGAANSFAGAVGGGGALSLGGGATNFASTATITTARLTQTGGTTTFGGTFAYAGNYVLSGGTLALAGGQAANFTGKAAFGGMVTGAGTVTASGVTQLTYAGVLDGSAVLSLTGAANINNGYYVVGQSASSVAQLQIQATGTLRLAGNGPQIISSSVKARVVNAGTIVSAAGTATIGAGLNHTGAIAIQGGVLSLTGSANSIAGAVNGAGVLALSSGVTTFKTGVTLAEAGLVVNGGSVSVATSITYAGNWMQNSGTVTAQKGFTLALGGASALLGGSLYGGGAVTLANVEFGGGFDLDMTGTATVTGSALQTSSITVNALAASTGSLKVAAGASYAIQSNASIQTGAGTGSFNNAGTLTKTGAFGQSDINVKAISTGAIVVAGGVLDLQGVGNSLGGTISGAGTLALNSGTTTLAFGLSLTVSNLSIQGAKVILGGPLTYAGNFAMGSAGGSLTLGAGTSTFSGAAYLGEAIFGPGTMAMTGLVQLNGADIESATVSLAASAMQTGDIYLNFSSSGSAALSVLATGSYEIDAGNINAGAGATVSNAGTIVAASVATTTTIGATVINTGLIEAAGAGIAFAQPVSGAGTIQIDAGSAASFGGNVAAATKVAFAGASGLLSIAAGASFDATINGFVAGDEVALGAFNFSTVQPLAFAGGVLTVTDGTTTANLHFGGAGLSLSSFALAIDQSGSLGIFHT